MPRPAARVRIRFSKHSRSESICGGSDLWHFGAAAGAAPIASAGPNTRQPVRAGSRQGWKPAGTRPVRGAMLSTTARPRQSRRNATCPLMKDAGSCLAARHRCAPPEHNGEAPSSPASPGAWNSIDRTRSAVTGFQSENRVSDPGEIPKGRQGSGQRRNARSTTRRAALTSRSRSAAGIIAETLARPGTCRLGGLPGLPR